ncbi:MAG: HEAT repeat domain-containing protein, partial [Armatimonadota bacterium]|nr:HEAT repeat domain-containing protein [Armatimonadota bacterium]
MRAVIEHSLLRHLSEANRFVRAEALRALAKVAGTRKLETFRQMRYDSDALVRCAALEALVSLDSDSDARNELTTLIRHPDSFVRKWACEAVAAAHAHEATPSLIQALRDRSPLVRKAACKALCAVASTNSAREIEQLLDDNNQFVRRAAKTSP